MIDFYQNSNSGHLILLGLMLEVLSALEASLQLFPTPFQVCGLWHSGSGTIQTRRHMGQDEAVFKIPVSEHEFSLFLFFSNIEVFQWCLFKITIFFFKEQNCAIAIMLLLGLLTGHWCICKGCSWKYSFFCLGQRRKKLYLLLRSCPEWKCLKERIF